MSFLKVSTSLLRYNSSASGVLTQNRYRLSRIKTGYVHIKNY